MNKTSFFSLDLKQSVNQWLGIGLLVVMCFWVVVYYFVNSTAVVSDKFVKIAATTQPQDLTY